jgi:hypothetical protein
MYDNHHMFYLDRLVNNLDYLRTDRREIDFILKEPLWFRKGETANLSLCDLIVGYQDGTMSAVELKGSYKKRGKALNQLQQGRGFIQDCLGGVFREGLFVVYQGVQGYGVEVYNPNFLMVDSFVSPPKP